ncbi:MAG: TRAP transporter small permease [Synergistaceae bacterium]|nr:TRAP transporter small permease [Synergistaceae bacterium]MBR0094316.1 TRAP transporter small permease [Synergistaceae bacterium]
MHDHPIIKKIRRITDVAVVTLFSIVVIVVSAQVFSRFVMKLSIRWADELSRFAFVWLVYIGGAVTIRDGRNVCFDLLLDSRKGKSWKVMFTLVSLVSMLFLILMTYFGVLVCQTELTESSPIMHWPMAVVCAAIPLGGCLMMLEEICYWLEHKNDRDE